MEQRIGEKYPQKDASGQGKKTDLRPSFKKMFLVPSALFIGAASLFLSFVTGKLERTKPNERYFQLFQRLT